MLVTRKMQRGGIRWSHCQGWITFVEEFKRPLQGEKLFHSNNDIVFKGNQWYTSITTDVIQSIQIMMHAWRITGLEHDDGSNKVEGSILEF